MVQWLYVKVISLHSTAEAKDSVIAAWDFSSLVLLATRKQPLLVCHWSFKAFESTLLFSG